MKNAQRLDPHVAQWVVQAATRLTSTFAIVQGVAIVGGGPARWQGPAFATALTVPGAPGSWGVVLFLFGAAGLAGTFTYRERLVAAGMTGICAWCMFFAMSFVKTAHENSRAATTGIWAYGFICIVALLLAGAYLQSQDGGQDGDELTQ